MENFFDGRENNDGAENLQPQKFKMADNPYQDFLHRKSAEYGKDFTFVPPKKEEYIRDNGQQRQVNFPQTDSRYRQNAFQQNQNYVYPNPYGNGYPGNFGANMYSQGFNIPGEYRNMMPRPMAGIKTKKKVNIGLIIFLIITGIVFCFMVGVFAYLLSVDMERSFPQISVPETEETSDEYKKYLRDDVLIELVPQSVSPDASAEKAYEKIQPSTILIISTLSDWEDPAGEFSQGTGVIVHSDGYAVTNSHVVDDTRNSKIKVMDYRGNMWDAVVVGCDKETDIAVIKIDGENFMPAEFAETENLKVGQEIVALGNPDGIYYRNSLSKGIVSAVGRKVDSEVSYIQMDAAINPGNSGGPLCNMEGQIIGINTSKLVKPNYDGIAFAIPSDTVCEIANDLIKYGEVQEKVTLGIYGYRITENESAETGEPIGVCIEEIMHGGSVEKSELTEGDIIVSLDGEPVDSVEDIKRILYGKKEGDVLTVEYMRFDETSEEVWVKKTAEVTLFYQEEDLYINQYEQ